MEEDERLEERGREKAMPLRGLVLADTTRNKDYKTYLLHDASLNEGTTTLLSPTLFDLRHDDNDDEQLSQFLRVPSTSYSTQYT